MINWEDFRHADDLGKWYLGPGDIYGALFDGNGNIIVDFPTIDDTGMPDEGRTQWRPMTAYNPDRHEYLVTWTDTRPSLQDSRGVYGRFINADGTFRGESFIIADAPQAQGSQEVLYIAKEKKYFNKLFSDKYRRKKQIKYTPFNSVLTS